MYYKNGCSHFLASLSSAKDFIGIGGGLNLKSIFIISCANPPLETIAIAVYTLGNCSVENFLVSLSGTGELLK